MVPRAVAANDYLIVLLWLVPSCMAWQFGFTPCRLSQMPVKVRFGRPSGEMRDVSNPTFVQRGTAQYKTSSSTALSSIFGNLPALPTSDVMTTGVEIAVAAGMLWALVWSMNPDTTKTEKDTSAKENTSTSTKKSEKDTAKENKTTSAPKAAEEPQQLPAQASTDKERVFEKAVFAAAAEMQKQLEEVAEQETQQAFLQQEVLQEGEEEADLVETAAAPDNFISSRNNLEMISPAVIKEEPVLDVKTLLREQSKKEAEELDEEHQADELRSYLQQKASEQTLKRMEQTTGRSASSAYLGSLSETTKPPKRSGPELKLVNTHKKEKKKEHDDTPSATLKAEQKVDTKVQVMDDDDDVMEEKTVQTKLKKKASKPLLNTKEKEQEPKLLNTITKEDEDQAGELVQAKKENLSIRAFLKRRSIIIGVFAVVLGRRLLLTWLGRGGMM